MYIQHPSYIKVLHQVFKVCGLQLGESNFWEVRFPSWTSFQFIGFQFSSWEHVLFFARHTPWESLQYLHWLAHMRPDSRYSLDAGSINFCRLIWFSHPANFSLCRSPAEDSPLNHPEPSGNVQQQKLQQRRQNVAAAFLSFVPQLFKIKSAKSPIVVATSVDIWFLFKEAMVPCLDTVHSEVIPWIFLPSHLATSEGVWRAVPIAQTTSR